MPRLSKKKSARRALGRRLEKFSAIAKSGFTLIELALVVVLLSVVAAVSLPSFRQSYKKILLERTTNDLAYLMRYAQSRAISKGQKILLVFDGDLKTCWLEEMTEEETTTNGGQGSQPPKQLTAKKSARLSNRWGRNFSIPQELIVQTDGTPPIGFYPDGKIDRLTMSVCYAGTCNEANAGGPGKSIDEKSCSDRCMSISTKYQRGAVQIFDERLDDGTKKTGNGPTI